MEKLRDDFGNKITSLLLFYIQPPVLRSQGFARLSPDQLLDKLNTDGQCEFKERYKYPSKDDLTEDKMRIIAQTKAFFISTLSGKVLFIVFPRSHINFPQT